MEPTLTILIQKQYIPDSSYTVRLLLFVLKTIDRKETKQDQSYRLSWPMQ